MYHAPCAKAFLDPTLKTEALFYFFSDLSGTYICFLFLILLAFVFKYKLFCLQCMLFQHILFEFKAEYLLTFLYGIP